MSNSRRPEVNQRLYFCRLHLDYLRSELEKEIIPKSVLEQGVGESILFHLLQTYYAYLGELAVGYNLAETRFSSAADVKQALQGANLASAQVNELTDLENSRSWLQQMISHIAEIEILSAKPTVRSSSAVQLLSVTQMDNDKLSFDSLQKCFDSLSNLIESQREINEEW